MTKRFQDIGIVGKQDDPAIKDAVLDLAAFLRQRGHRVLFEQATGALLGEEAETGLPASGLGEHCDLAIAVGGDGTLLHAARSVARCGVPVFGINLGRLGFLADISPRRMPEALEKILSGDFEEERRFLLEMHAGPAPNRGASSLALNDVVVHRWNSARMMEFETYIDGQFLNTQRSDGLIVSTPTGSTAYALSGGGPLLHPSLNALVLVPICPHTLSNRPIVVSGDSRVEISLCGSDFEHVRVTADGQVCRPLAQGERVFVRKSEHPVRLLHPRGHDYYQILRAKLGWSGHPSR